MRLELAQEAIADLEAIEEYGIASFGAGQAEAYQEDRLQAMSLLLEFPEFGASKTQGPPGLRRRPVGMHVICYRRDDDVLQVIRILHPRMDPSRHLG